LYGGRVSLAVGLLVVLIATPIALLIGGISGYYGGGVDTFIQRAVEVVLSFPRLPLMLAMAVVMRAFELDPVLQFMGIIAILALLGWAGLSRVVRGMFLSLRERDFVQAAKAAGASDLRIILRHIAPNMLTYLLVSATLTIPGVIIAESSLSFLGLGIQEPATSWGMLIQDATSLANIELHSWVLLPGLFIFVTVLAFNFAGDALRDAFDPYRVL
jgi:peptide/nickel transport system permease protein